MMLLMDKTHTQRAIELAGGQSELARHFNISREAVRQWEEADQVPVRRVLDVEKITGGHVTRYDLRPDIYGDPPRSAA